MERVSESKIMCGPVKILLVKPYRMVESGLIKRIIRNGTILLNA